MTVRVYEAIRHQGEAISHSAADPLGIVQAMKEAGSMFDWAMSDSEYIDMLARNAHEYCGVRVVLLGDTDAVRAEELVARLIQAGLMEKVE